MIEDCKVSLKNSVRNIITFSAAYQFTKLINAVSEWLDYRFVPKLDELLQ